MPTPGPAIRELATPRTLLVPSTATIITAMPISKDAFAKKMTDALRKSGVRDELRYDPERFALVNAEGDEFFLASAHQYYAEASFWERGNVLKRYSQSMFNEALQEFPANFNDARGNLVPVVRTTGYIDGAALLMQTRSARDAVDSTTPFVQLAGALCYGLAYDTPQTLTLISAHQLVQWNVGFDEAMVAARHNLMERSREPMKQIAPGLFAGPWEDANAASRFLLTELLARLPVKGDVVACVPGRDYLLVAGSDDANALGAMIGIAEQAIALPKAITPEMFRLEGASWRPFTLASDHPQASQHDRLVKAMLSADYEEQKALIDQLLQKSGADIFVAKYTAVEREGAISSWCSWAPCVSLLPRTDVIAIFDADSSTGEGQPPAMVPWDAAVDIVGHKMVRQEQYRLERYLVEQSPTSAEMVQLRSRAQ